MPPLRCLLPVLLLPLAVAAAEPFPGLQAVLTEAEWKRAGLDRLTPDEVGVIDAALIRHQLARAPLTREPEKAAAAGASEVDAPSRRSMWERFGFARDRDQGSWRDVPPLRARVTAWQGANRFVLDNGQVWEGVTPIPYELVGEQIAIEARPAGNFALVVSERSTAISVRRVK